MGDRDKARDRHRERDRDIDRDRKRDRDDWDRDRDRDRERERKDRERSKRSHTPDRIRSSRHTRSRTRSPDRHRSRSRSTDRHRRSRHQHRTPSPDLPRKRRKHGDEDRSAAVVSDFVDEIVREQQQKNHKDAADGVGGEDHMEMDSGELEMMKMLGIPVGFDSTKGKPVAGNDVSGIRAVTKRQPRQYMNRRGGFNRPLPAETNR